MTRLNLTVGASVSDQEKQLTGDSKVLMERVRQLEESLQAGLLELKNAVLSEQEPERPKSIEECVDRIISFESSAQKQLTSIKSAILKTEVKVREMKQTLLSNSLLIVGVPEKRDERTQHTVCNAVKKNLYYSITPRDIDFCFRVGQPGSTRGRPLLVRFVNKWVRNDIFNLKSLLKGTGMAIFEHLIPERLQLLKKARALVGMRNCWTRGGKVFLITGDEKRQISDVSDLDELD